jgi:hypothetical protein
VYLAFLYSSSLNVRLITINTMVAIELVSVENISPRIFRYSRTDNQTTTSTFSLTPT